MASNKEYRVVQEGGKISWSIEEVWDGGVKRGPFGSKAAAIAKEENIAKENGFINELALTEAGEEITAPAGAFEKDEKGNWLCVKTCSIDMEKKEISLSAGWKFTKGNLYLGVDVAKWLEEHQEK